MGEAIGELKPVKVDLRVQESPRRQPSKSTSKDESNSSNLSLTEIGMAALKDLWLSRQQTNHSLSPPEIQTKSELNKSCVNCNNQVRFENNEKKSKVRIGDDQIGKVEEGETSTSCQAATSRAKFAIKSYTLGCLYTKRLRSLVHDAKLDTLRNKELASLGSCDDEDGEEKLTEPANEPERIAGSLHRSLTRALTSIDGFLDFPRHISQLDQCNHLLIKYEPELDPTHPGFHDHEYRARRKEVAQIAFDYKWGQQIPRIEYNDKEIETWRYIYIRLKDAYAKYACTQHNKAIEELELYGGYSPDSIPQLQDVSDFLFRRTGWRLRPAAGLLSARDFLASLAYRVFQTTQYIRHWGNPEHSVEPDCIHELMGHIPILCDPSFAQFSQELGLASLGATDEQIEKFATLYWFTVEFGLCRENGKLKCYGAGLLSSYGEMEHALESGIPTLKEFVPEKTAVEEYDDAEYQVTYYVADSFEDAKAKIKAFADRNLKRDFELAYDPYSCSVRRLDCLEQLSIYANQVRNDVSRLVSAIEKMREKDNKSAS